MLDIDRCSLAALIQIYLSLIFRFIRAVDHAEPKKCDEKEHLRLRTLHYTIEYSFA